MWKQLCTSFAPSSDMVVCQNISDRTRRGMLRSRRGSEKSSDAPALLYKGRALLLGLIGTHVADVTEAGSSWIWTFPRVIGGDELLTNRA